MIINVNEIICHTKSVIDIKIFMRENICDSNTEYQVAHYQLF